MVIKAFHTFSPLLRLLFFIALFVTMTGISTLIGSALGPLIFGSSVPDIQHSDLEQILPAQINALKLVQTSNQIFGFLGAALLFVLLFGKQSVNGFLVKPGKLLLLAPILMLASLPFMEQSIALNEALIPAGGWIETNLKPFQELADQLTVLMLSNGDHPSLFLNIVLFAVVPAICEEFAFRGVIQSQIVKMFGNAHIGIWVSAIVFSAIHMQFYGFIPRMLLGAVFGYLVIYSGTIWSAVLAHFVNNSLAVLSVHYYGKLEVPDDSLEASVSNLPMSVLSLILVALGIYFLYQKGNWKKISSEYLMDSSSY
jgi:uncharacterized protein